MKHKLAFALILAFPLIVACQKDDAVPTTNTTASTATAKSPQLVRAANGADLSVPCLQELAADLAKASATSMDQAQQLAQSCDVRGLVARSSSRGTQHKDWDDYRYYNCPGYSYAAYYNPRSYCNGGYYNPGFFSAIYGGAFNYGNYGNGWQLRSLGYAYYGYGSYGYNGYGVKGEDFCTTSCSTVTSSNQDECFAKCWGKAQLN